MCSAAPDQTKAESLELEGNLGPRDASELHVALLAALGGEDEVVVDARRVTSLDVSILQVLIAADIAAEKLGRTITLLRVPEGAVEATFARAGLAIPPGFSLPQLALSR
ncbi:STAS domain-containing protein [Rhodomicrobium vannielii ATCC 17100]|uniref:STAS domain-containing protein n=1 Tax=Rhodomicrobium vannielii TaxID=1069 RepID=UPI00191AFA07|nr:STAS domain-containing protein [Rhodomicrobium vannielii]MBJ7535756.1 STAS domain-containing protein [Rhodomicrobium vannielii ATCC 17100]